MQAEKFSILLVQTRRNAKAAKRFFQSLVARFGEPGGAITDKLRSYVKTLAPNAGPKRWPPRT
jgi:putative transposase